MNDFDSDRFLTDIYGPFYALDFQWMIGDVRDFLESSEENIEIQYQTEVSKIDQDVIPDEYPDGYKEHQMEIAFHRFTVSLPLRIRYSVLVALITSVEWSIEVLSKKQSSPIPPRPKGERINETVRLLRELNRRTEINQNEVIADYQALVRVRNCVAHSSGLIEHCQNRSDAEKSIQKLNGFGFKNLHFLGVHVWIERGALIPYINVLADLVVKLHKVCSERNLLIRTAPIC